MSSETAEAGAQDQQEQAVESADESGDGALTETRPLTIELPDGSASVSDAILAHREMLRGPEEHGLATGEDITHLSEAMDTLSTEIEETGQESEETREEVEQLRETVERQRRQIVELQATVDSLAEILGTSTEWETFDADEAAPDVAGD